MSFHLVQSIFPAYEIYTQQSDQVSTNGYVTLGESVGSSDPDVNNVAVPIFLPFAGDLMTTALNGRICYSLHYANDAYLDEINNHLRRIGRSTVSATYALVITYYSVKDHRAPSRTTFQVALFSDGSDTRVLFNYANSSFPWSVSRRIQVGYSYGRSLDPNDEYTTIAMYTSTSNSNNDSLQLGATPGNTGAYDRPLEPLLCRKR